MNLAMIDAAPAAFRVWLCGRCQHELLAERNCPCHTPDLACANCDAHYSSVTGDFLRFGGAA